MQELPYEADALRHLASIVCPWWADPGKVILVMLSFAFDAGGSESTRVLTVSGFGSSEKDWRDFSGLWSSRLAQDEIAYFRAVDAAFFRGPFEHWSDRSDREELRKNLFGDLMTILKSHVYRKFGCSIINSAFSKMNEVLREEFALTAYSVAGRTVEKEVRAWIKKEWTTHTPIALVFEAGDKGRGKLMQRLTENGGFPPIFRPKKDTVLDDGTVVHGYIPLQAADWLAYELSLAVQWIEDGKAQEISDLRWAMQEFHALQGIPGTYAAGDVQELEKGFTLTKTIDDWERSVGIGRYAAKRSRL